jgi:hypothetical protein
MSKVIVRIKGGLGNQLFCYAAARRLALVNQSDLAIDHVTGFSRDRQYQRKYMLDHFSIPVRKATPSERLEPFDRYRRGLAKYLSRRQPFHGRGYLEQERLAFDQRLLEYRPKCSSVYLDGLWQGEKYFKDVESQIRDDLRIIPPGDRLNHEVAERMAGCNSICVHVRWFQTNDSTQSTDNLGIEYYQNAIRYIEERICEPHFFIFSDDPDASMKLLNLPEGRLTFIRHNRGDECAYADLWLMTQCRHMITANSTFSWWGAWLGESQEKVIICPGAAINGASMAWGFDGLLPDRWVRI